MSNLLRRPRLVALSFAVVLTFILGAAACVPSSLPALLPEPLPDFSLTTHARRPLTRADLSGRPWVANFIFTRCTSICPPFTTKMAAIAKRSAAQVPGLQLVSFSMDPEHDSPAVLSAFAQERQIDTTRWTFLTGPREQMEAAVIKGLFQPWDKGNGSLVSIGHSSRFVLIDARGQIRGFYPSTEEGAVERVVNDARILAAETAP